MRLNVMDIADLTNDKAEELNASRANLAVVDQWGQRHLYKGMLFATAAHSGLNVRFHMNGYNDTPIQVLKAGHVNEAVVQLTLR